MKQETKLEQEVDFSESLAILLGTVIGAGILGIPFVVAKAGLGIGIIIMLIVVIVLTFEKLFLAEVTLRTNDYHQLPGYAQKYLGKHGKWVLTFTEIFSYYGAIIAYIIGGGLVLSEIFGGDKRIWSLIFFTFGAVLIYFGLTLIKKFELWLTLGILVTIVAISFLAFQEFKIEQDLFLDWNNIFIPYGTILFAFAGASAVPQMRRVLVGQERDLKKSIMLGNSLIFLLYLVFTISVIGATGVATTEIATMGLGQLLGQKVIYLANIFALFTMGTSFLTLGLAIRNVYHLDYHINKKISFFLTCSIPLIIYLLGMKSFIRTIDFVGATAGGLTGILIVLMYWQAKEKGDRKPEFSLPKFKVIGSIIIIMFAVGMLYAIYNNLFLVN